MAREVAARQGTRKGDFLAGKYLLEECLGVGGMGEVYRATNMSLGRKVAIKILSPEFVENEDDVLRFLREARAAAAVRHPHVVDVLDVARDDDGTPFIVQELLSGQDLEQHMKSSGGRLTVAEILEVMIPVTDAISAAHAAGLVHRDLKPANVFLAREGTQPLRPKVLDFGACLYETVGELSKEERRMLIGTPHYMAPEQISSKTDVDARADVWALGVMIYELLVGQTPFEGSTAAEVMRLVRTRPAPPLRKVVKSAPEELEEVVAQCLQIERKLRYPDAAALRDALVGVRRALSPSSRIETAPEIEPVRVPASARVPVVEAPPPSRPRPAAAEAFVASELDLPMEPDDDQGSEPSLPPVLDPRAAAPAAKESSKDLPREAASPRPPRVEAPSPSPPLGPAALSPPAVARPATPSAEIREGDKSKPALPAWAPGQKVRVAATILVPAFALFGLARSASFLTAPIGRAMRGESVVASGVLAVLSLVAAAALAAKAFSGRSRGIMLATASAFALGIVMIIVTFAASDAAELGPPAIASIAPFVAPLVPLGLAWVAFEEVRDLWPRKYHRTPALAFAALTSFLVFAALELGPLGAFRHGAAPPPAPPTASAAP